MFGYVKIFKPEMRFCEYEQYRGVYCSLCQALGKRYGFVARMTLSYDFTFLALFHMALSNQEISFTEGRCPFRPTKKRAFCVGDGTKAIDYAADIAVILTYHKLSDTVKDERFFKALSARVLRFLVKSDFNKAVSRRPLEAKWAQEYMDAQQMAEKDACCSVDQAAHPTAEFLSRIACVGIEEDVPFYEVSRFGYCLGRYIYLADAAEDYLKDKKSGSFNPYILYEFQKDTVDDSGTTLQAYMTQTLHSCVAVCAECYDELPIHRFDSILRNVIYRGMPFTIQQIEKKQQEDNRNE